MTEFQVGDKVRAVRDAQSWNNYDRQIPKGEIRTIRIIDKWGAARDGYTLNMSDGGVYKAEDFEHETYVFQPGGEPIDYDSVQMGDTIAALTFGSWRIAKVGCIRGTFIDNEKNDRLAYNDSDTTEIRLLHRPEPEVDQVQVTALVEVIQNIPYTPLRDIGVDYAGVDFTPLAEALVKAGVKVDA